MDRLWTPAKEEETMQYEAPFDGRLAGISRRDGAAPEVRGKADSAGAVWLIYAALTVATAVFLLAVAGMASGLVPAPHM
jgi:hypothetical protein